MDFYAHIAEWEVFELFILCVFCLCGVWVLRFFWKEFRHWQRQRQFHKMIHVMDIQRLEEGRSLVLFSCPFSRGVVLVSPKGDQVVLFENKDDLENDYR